ncbi:hypothetical protein BGZ76_010474 [Entomortierella beljakovae]|nr:hypothetical protein BGZ76_010474 [Entomortierella beljakovae]
MTGFMSSHSDDSIRQRKRHQMLSSTLASPSSPIPPPKELPKDTLGAIHYLLDLLHPLKIKQQKVFPRVCMIHQIYSIITDHTTVDRTLAQLINDNTIRKFYVGGTGSDEFAIMLTSDYVEQIQQAKEHYLKDLQHSENKRNSNSLSSSPSSKRKAEHSNTITTNQTAKSNGSNGDSSNKRLITENAIIETNSRIKEHVNHDQDSDTKAQSSAGIFDRFKDLIIGGHCLEISIQHSNIQSVIGATDQDIT